MTIEIAAAPKVLVVTEDLDLRETYTILLEEETCAVTTAATATEALRAVAVENYALVLLSTFRGGLQQTLALAKQVRHLAAPTPIGLLSPRLQVPSELDMHILAFILPMPFEIDEFSAAVHGALSRELTATAQAHARTVRSFLDALETQNWQALAALCTANVRLYPSAHARFMRSQAILGQEAVRTYLKTRYPQQGFRDTVIYPRTHGVVARYTVDWRPASAPTQHAVGSMLFHFAGERIDQIGLRLTPPVSITETGRLMAQASVWIPRASAS